MDKEEKSTGASKGAELLSADPKKTSTILKSVGIGLVALSLAVSTAALIVVLTMNKKSPVTHLVSFRNYDNALIATETIKDGEVATKPDITPTKPADSVNTYAFSGWDKEFTTTITEDVTFTAQYASTPIPVVTPTPTYTVRFLNDDTSKSVLYSCSITSGEKASYQGVTPTKDADNQYTYSFKGWDTDPATVTITANKDFTAQYNKTAIEAPITKYTVRFLNSDGSVLYSCSVASGAKATYQGVTPTRASDNKYNYSFKGWDTDPSSLTISTSHDFIAQYKQTTIEVPDTTYLVRFLNDDDSILYSCSIVSGQKASYQGVIPTKSSDAQYTYSFKGWDTDPTTVTITSAKDFVAQYNKTAIVVPATTYTVRFLNDDNSILYSCSVTSGNKATYQGVTPTKASDAQYTYAFKGWDTDPTTVTITSAKDFTAQYNQTAIPGPSVVYYNVVFRNGSVAYNTQSIAEGGYASVPATNPTKASDENGSYSFTGWDHDPATTIINGYTEFNAVYNNTPITTYNVRFLNEDDTVLYTETIASGNKASYGSTTPTKAATTDASYKFAGWDKDISVAITANTDFKAKYDTYYQATFLDEDGTFLDRQEIKAGSHASTSVVPTKSKKDFTTYTFSAWKDKVTGTEASSLAMSKNVTFVPTFTESQITSSGLELTPDDVDSPTYYTVAGYTGTDEYVVIPETNAIDGVPVTHIGNSAFAANDTIKGVMGKSITVIDDGNSDGAFYACMSLVQVSFPNLVTVGSYAFFYCVGLTTMACPHLTTVNAEAFNGCSSFKPQQFTGIKTIGDYAFSACSSLEDLGFLTYCTSIGNNAFEGSGLKSASFPFTTSIGDEAFVNCADLQDLTFFNLETISAGMFSSCNSLSSISLNSVTEVKASAFEYCSNLTSVYFSKVTTIGAEAFNDCSLLSRVLLPKVTSIDATAFDGCTAISYATMEKPDTINTIMKNSVVQSWFECNNVSAIIDIPDNAFKGLTHFYSFVSTNPVKSIGKYAFYNTEISSIPSISSHDFTINSFGFAKCTNLTSIKLDGTITLTVYEDAFAGIGYIDELTLPLSTTFNNSNTGDEYKISRYNPFLGDSFGSVTFAGTKDQFNAIQTRDAPKFGLTSLFPVGTIITCSDGNITITA